LVVNNRLLIASGDVGSRARTSVGLGLVRVQLLGEPTSSPSGARQFGRGPDESIRGSGSKDLVSTDSALLGIHILVTG
jgi:hypothetical protein